MKLKEVVGKAGRGVQLEWAIVYWSLKLSKSPDLKKRIKEHPELKVYGEGEMRDAAISAVKVAKAGGAPIKKARHSDEENIKGDPEPKTDITFGNQRVSVKMTGAIQLTSSEGRRTAKMFQDILDQMKNDKEWTKDLREKVLKGIIERIEKMPSKMLDAAKPANLEKAAKLKPKDFMKMVQKGKVLDEYNWSLWSKNNKIAILKDVEDYLEKSPEFKYRLIEEALTGKRNFGKGNRATADYILTPNFYGKIDESYIKKMMKTTKIDVRAKSRSGITSVTMRFDVADAAKAAAVALNEDSDEGIIQKGVSAVKNFLSKSMKSLKSKLSSWYRKNIDAVVDGALDDLTVTTTDLDNLQKESLTNTKITYKMLEQMVEEAIKKAR